MILKTLVLSFLPVICTQLNTFVRHCTYSPNAINNKIAMIIVHCLSFHCKLKVSVLSQSANLALQTKV